jgi:hypothetical protein
MMLLVMYQLKMKIRTTISAAFLLLPANIARMSDGASASQLTRANTYITKLQQKGEYGIDRSNRKLTVVWMACGNFPRASSCRFVFFLLTVS